MHAVSDSIVTEFATYEDFNFWTCKIDCIDFCFSLLGTVPEANLYHYQHRSVNYHHSEQSNRTPRCSRRVSAAGLPWLEHLSSMLCSSFHLSTSPPPPPFLTFPLFFPPRLPLLPPPLLPHSHLPQVGCNDQLVLYCCDNAASFSARVSLPE